MFLTRRRGGKAGRETTKNFNAETQRRGEEAEKEERADVLDRRLCG
jgi:hypothetical protein